MECKRLCHSNMILWYCGNEVVRCKVWWLLMKLEDRNMLWKCLLKIRSFGGIMTLVESLYIVYILWIFCGIDMKCFQIILWWSWLMMNVKPLRFVWKFEVKMEVSHYVGKGTSCAILCLVVIVVVVSVVIGFLLIVLAELNSRGCYMYRGNAAQISVEKCWFEI